MTSSTLLLLAAIQYNSSSQGSETSTNRSIKLDGLATRHGAAGLLARPSARSLYLGELQCGEMASAPPFPYMGIDSPVVPSWVAVVAGRTFSLAHSHLSTLAISLFLPVPQSLSLHLALRLGLFSPIVCLIISIGPSLSVQAQVALVSLSLSRPVPIKTLIVPSIVPSRANCLVTISMSRRHFALYSS